MAEVPFIDVDRCDGCGECVKVCCLDGLVIVNNVVTIVNTVECSWCTECEAVCHTQAISCAYEIVFE